MTFENLNLSPALLKAVTSEGYTNPTPIQQQAIPIVMKGRDLLGCAQTGTGKTAAFAIPILQILEKSSQPNQRNKAIRALIVTPTRELAIQIADSFSAYGKFTGLTNTVIFGGVKQHQQTIALRKGVDVLIATPGRLLDLANQGYINMKTLEVFVLDEADRMLDMGFIHDVKKIISLLPAKRQTLLFSATMPPDIVDLANSLLKEPQRVDITPPSSTAVTVQQSVYFTEKKDKNDLLVYLLEKEAKDSTLVFTRTKHGADKVVKILARNNIQAQAIHGNKSQNARQNALSNFKSGKTRVLIATDIAARGIDVDGLSHVINFEIPNISETYVHRIGRTGRAGAAGKALSICTSEEYKDWKNIEKLIGQSVPVIKDHPYPTSHPSSFPAPSKPASTHAQKKPVHRNKSRRNYPRNPNPKA
ncbi:DEAD/DEAH box helicase [Pararhodonellum marinum]|uniref:DEAD/DEAH box helicase n=1 Tax=Pararhodonellum marinum TaxID=2755358 RepID=UPI00188E80CC|nr:DEAD/DEAH box helicase [Pararhodonellum marinum]